MSPSERWSTRTGNKEGKYTSGIGAETSFIDRQEVQQEIQTLLDQMFAVKDKIDFNEFKKFNQEVTSETLLCILNTLRNCLPCTNNFYLYMRNYRKVLVKGSLSLTPKETRRTIFKTAPMMTSSPIASPSIGKKFFATSLLVSEKMKKKDLPVRIIPSDVQNPLLKYALETNTYEDIKKFEEDKVQAAGAGFKNAIKQNEEKTKRLLELAKDEASNMKKIDYNAVRMPNQKNLKIKTEDYNEDEKQDNNSLKVLGNNTTASNILMSPSGFLNNHNTFEIKDNKICICGRMFLEDEEEY